MIIASLLVTTSVSSLEVKFSVHVDVDEGIPVLNMSPCSPISKSPSPLTLSRYAFTYPMACTDEGGLDLQMHKYNPAPTDQ